ncbi:short chain dehydrogenase [Colletotrichum sublineola]|nr:short chain dehydrogenase [Colletotrichum sublineola]
MSVYVITGVSKGIGFEFLKQYSDDSKNLVIGLVRDKTGTEKKVAAELGNRPNVHTLHADLTKYPSLKQAAADTAEIVGERGVDYLIANGALVPLFDAYGPIGDLSGDPEGIDAVGSELWQTNVVGNIHLFHLFLPLVLKGKVKKVICISTGLADLDFSNSLDVVTAPLYTASKAAVNAIVSRFSAQYKKDGVLFLSISPGLVEVGRYADATPEQLQGFGSFVEKLLAYAPDFKGPITPEESVRHVISTINRASIEGGHGGAFISHMGNKKWV